jgi:D-glycero-alpha-D-manno-heptose 1-phosphate guanylyltransferase
MTRTAIVLAGGLGTRLQHVVGNLPKPMAPVAGKPFLQYVLDYLGREDVNEIILAVGYLRESIINYFGNAYNGLSLKYSVEEEPLGTGGAIFHAGSQVESDSVFIVNGDTYFDVNLRGLYQFHSEKNAEITIALKRMERFDRYGTVEIDNTGCITGFKEKKYLEEGLINGGIYCLNRSVFSASLPQKFSFETEILEKGVERGSMFGLESEGYFIDIGIPSDYDKAQTELIRNSH